MTLKKVKEPLVVEDKEEINGKVFIESEIKRHFWMSLGKRNCIYVRGERTKAEHVLFWQILL